LLASSWPMLCLRGQLCLQRGDAVLGVLQVLLYSGELPGVSEKRLGLRVLGAGHLQEQRRLLQYR
jgi:hypothetical protein